MATSERGALDDRGLQRRVSLMGGLPNDAEAKKVIRVLKKEFGWQYDDDVAASAHPCGWLRCGHGCDIVVYKTGNNTARVLWKQARKCPHGRAPGRQHW